MLNRTLARTQQIHNEYAEAADEQAKFILEGLSTFGVPTEQHEALMDMIHEYASKVSYANRAFDRVENHPDFDGDYSY